MGISDPCSSKLKIKKKTLIILYQGGNGNDDQKTASGEPKFGANLKNNKNSENCCRQKFRIIKTQEKFGFWASEKILKGGSYYY